MSEKIKKAVENIEKKFGKGSIIAMDGSIDYSIQRVSTGSFALDLATGGGWPKGRIIEIVGPESSGKSTLVLIAIKKVQDEGGVAAYIDSENSFDPIYAENLGIDLSPERFIFSQPDCGEDALSIAEELLKTGEIDIIGIDSVAALTPKAEIEGEFGEAKMGLQARLMGQAMRKLTGLISKSNCIAIFTNQIRMQIGVMFGNPETTPGGNALKFYASVRCDIRRKEIEKDKEGAAISNKVKVKIIKNKTAPPFREAQFSIIYGEGIDKYGELVDLAVEYEILKKSGSWFSYNDIKVGQGRDFVVQRMREDQEFYAEILSKLKDLFSLE